MNVASLLQDSPSDDRERRLQLQQQQRQEQFLRDHPPAIAREPPPSSIPAHPHRSHSHSSGRTPSSTPPLFPVAARPPLHPPPPPSLLGQLSPPGILYGRERERERERDRERLREVRDHLPPSSSLSMVLEKDIKRHPTDPPRYHPDDRRDRAGWEREQRHERDRDRHSYPVAVLHGAGSIIPEILPATPVRRYSPIREQHQHLPPNIASAPPMDNAPHHGEYAPPAQSFVYPPMQKKNKRRRRDERPSPTSSSQQDGRNQFEMDWDVRQDEPTLYQKHKQAPIPIPGPSTMPLRHSLGSYIYPDIPFPLASFPPTLRNSERQISFDLIVPQILLITKSTPTALEGAKLWGGARNALSGRRIYTDDSDLCLIPIHVGLIALSEYRRPQSDLKLTFSVIPRDAKAFPVRWDGSDEGGVRSYPWGNGHDGHGVELTNVEWEQDHAFHISYRARRRSRLKLHDEERRALLDIPLNVDFSSEPSDLHPYRMKPGEVDIISDTWRWLPRGQLRLFHAGENDGMVDVDVEKTRQRLRHNETIIFTTSGELSYKYTASSLSQVLFPHVYYPSSADPSGYLPDRERPRKRRRVGSDGDSSEEAIEVESVGEDIMLFRRSKTDEDKGKSRKWDVSFEGSNKESSTKDTRTSLELKGLSESSFEFTDEGVLIWQMIPDKEVMMDVGNESEAHRVREAILFKARIWKWRRHQQTRTPS